uniref:ABC transporter ATP-binding protein n=1 Tax=candidate division WOR-3 bacterium TaxID=2052148 RepID=A0A7V3PT57_UNCW3
MRTAGGLKPVINFWKRHLWLAVGLFLLTVIGAVLAIAFPYLLRLIVDGIKMEITRGKLNRYVLLLTGFGVLRAVMDVVLPFIRGRTNEQFQWEVRSRVFGQILDAGYAFTIRFPTGDVMERLDHDLQELSWFACSGIFRFVNAGLIVLFTLVMLFRMNVLLTLLIFGPVSLGVWGWLRAGPLIYKWFMKWREKIAEVNNQLQAAFSGIRLVKAFVIEERLAEKFKATLKERVAVAVNETRVEGKVQVVYMMIAEFATLLILWVGGILVIRNRLTLGEFVAFNAYVLMLLPMMFDIGNLFVAGKRASGAGERVQELVKFEPGISQQGPGRKSFAGEIRLEQVSFAYNSNPVLKNISMVIKPGKRIGIAGTVGSGKSTIVRLILRLIEPKSGRILLNQEPVTNFELTGYRRLFGYAPQEPTLFSLPLRENITLDRRVSAEQLKKVIALARLEDDISALKNGLDEVLGERGTGLSGGQKARVAIARAVLEMPEYIILDDASSALDADTEQEFFERLFAELPGRTFIVISHRLKVLSMCDYIYVLDRGEIVEEGTPAELLSKSGLYYQLYQRQLLKEELERL